MSFVFSHPLSALPLQIVFPRFSKIPTSFSPIVGPVRFLPFFFSPFSNFFCRASQWAQEEPSCFSLLWKWTSCLRRRSVWNFANQNNLLVAASKLWARIRGSSHPSRLHHHAGGSRAPVQRALQEEKVKKDCVRKEFSFSSSRNSCWSFAGPVAADL